MEEIDSKEKKRREKQSRDARAANKKAKKKAKCQNSKRYTNNEDAWRLIEMSQGEREAYYSLKNKNFRITFDFNLRFTIADLSLIKTSSTKPLLNNNLFSSRS